MLDNRSQQTLLRLKLNEEELDLLIEDCIKLGWRNERMFIPPDDRINWCAEWMPYKEMYIPHWINRERPLPL